MQREEILEKSRRENGNRDMAELEATNRAGRIASIVGMLLCLTITALDWNLTKTLNCACWTVNYGMLSAMYYIRYQKLRRGRQLAMALVYSGCFAFFCWGYIHGLLAAM